MSLVILEENQLLDNTQLVEQNSLLTEVVDKLEKGNSNLRFAQACIAASNIAEQYFCEKKVEMQFLHGEIPTKSKQLGSEAHSLLLSDSIKVKREDIFRRIRLGEPVFLLETPLLSRYGDIILAGRPDAIVFYKAMPLLLFEYKFSESPIPYKSYHIQAKVYCKILEGLGFDTSKLCYVIVVVPPSMRNDKELSRKIMRAVLKNYPKENRLEVDGVNVYIYPYHPEDAEKDIDWALDFGKGVREAIPTKNPNKCKKCEYSEDCSASLS